MGMYGDGEWNAIFNSFNDIYGDTNAEGTIYTKELCQALKESLKFQSENFYFSTPEGLRDANLSGVGEKRIDKCLEKLSVKIEFLEKDCWNEWAREAKLFPFSKELKKHNVAIISNKALRGLTFLNYDKFIEIGYPNCFGDIDRAIEEALAYGKSGVYLVAAGLPAAIFCQRLHGRIKESWFLDCGSIWDGFTKIGAQRKWRELLYKDEKLWQEWFNKNVYGD